VPFGYAREWGGRFINVFRGQARSYSVYIEFSRES